MTRKPYDIAANYKIITCSYAN